MIGNQWSRGFSRFCSTLRLKPRLRIAEFENQNSSGDCPASTQLKNVGGMTVAPPQGRTQGAGQLLCARHPIPSPSPARRRERTDARPGTGSAVFQASAAQVAPRRNSGHWKSVSTTTNRNPLFLFLLSGSFLLRSAQRTLFSSLLNAPPRNTRRVCVSLPPQRRPAGPRVALTSIRSFWSRGFSRFLQCVSRPAKALTPAVYIVTFFHPPNSRPISATISDTC